MLPATFEGRWIRLRPISRKDHPLIFALRLKTAGSERQDLSIPAPTFDDWESRELADLLSSGPAFVVETRDEEFCGIARMSRVNVRDGWSYIGVRLYPDLLDTALSRGALGACDVRIQPVQSAQAVCRDQLGAGSTDQRLRVRWLPGGNAPHGTRLVRWSLF